jgi:hypothetical protein
VITAVVGVVILVLALAVVVAIARDRGPGPGDAAVAYELAWDRLDFESVYTLSGAELRDGLDRRGFVAAKRAAYQQQHALRGLVDRVGVDEAVSVGDAAVVITRVELGDHTVVRNRVELARRHARWHVVAYRLEPSIEDTPHANGATS